MPESNQEKNELLLTAYLDGELGENERAQAEVLIKSNPQYAELVEQWRESGNALRSLPQSTLGANFSNRVLSSSEFLKAVEQSKSQARSRTNSAGVSLPPAATESYWSGLIAIASLAAMLLLTLFVFPNFVENSVAKVDPELKTELVADPSEVNDPPEMKIEQLVVDPVRPIVRTSRLKAERVPNQGGIVGVASSQTAVEEVLIIKVASADIEGVEGILKRNAIKIEDGDVEETDSSAEAIYLVSTPKQMRKMIGQMAAELSAQVTTFPLPLSVVKAGSSTRLSSLKFNGDAEQVKEIEELDRWFGLSGKDDDNKPVRFLLLVGQ